MWRSSARVLFAGAVVAAAAPAQNLLVWDRWQAWNPQYVHVLRVMPDWIDLGPYSPVPAACGLEQQVTVPRAGLYQLHFAGFGGTSGTLEGGWSVGAQELPTFVSHHRQASWTLYLPSGTQQVRFRTSTSNMPVDGWRFRQPVLRPVVGPSIDVDVVGDTYFFAQPRFALTTPAHVVLASLQPAQPPLPIPGFAYGLELDPGAGLLVLAAAPAGQIDLSISPSLLWQIGRMDPLWLQAVSLDPVPIFGSALLVDAMQFSP